MEPYSLDLRQRVVAAVEEGDGTIADVAAKFRVGKTFVKKMLRLWREKGALALGSAHLSVRLPRPA